MTTGYTMQAVESFRRAARARPRPRTIAPRRARGGWENYFRANSRAHRRRARRTTLECALELRKTHIDSASRRRAARDNHPIARAAIDARSRERCATTRSGAPTSNSARPKSPCTPRTGPSRSSCITSMRPRRVKTFLSSPSAGTTTMSCFIA